MVFPASIVHKRYPAINVSVLYFHPIRLFPPASYRADEPHPCSRLALCIIKCHPHAVHPTARIICMLLTAQICA